MKENSRKEDIKIIEEMIENMDMNDCFGGEHIEAIEHILSDYKRVLKENEELKYKSNISKTGSDYWCMKYAELQKENEELKETNEILQDLYWNECIPNQIVEDKIEEIDEKIKHEENEKVVIYLHKQKRSLQELLEGRK